MVHITLVAGTRPNFVKISPIIRAIEKQQLKGVAISYRLVHTGQHYNPQMSSSFFEELEIPSPDFNLGVGSGSQAEQTGAIMTGFEKVLLENPTDLVLVVGDVTSTMACSIVAKKLNIRLAHVEGGIRSFDNSMPEEINRKVTDSITDYFFTTSEFANRNLAREGVDAARIFFVGNVMIDTLQHYKDKLRQPSFFGKAGLEAQKYFVLTLHRPSNVDDSANLIRLLQEISDNVRGYPVVFPIHPRTAKILSECGVSFENLILAEPLPYLEFNYLVRDAFAVITDSGGITEETTYMGIPCFTLRENTERPETCITGTNQLIGSGTENIKPNLDGLFADPIKKAGIPELWDGHAADRIVSELINLFQE